MPPTMPAADVEIGPPLVRTLLRAQHPDLADQPLAVLANGWDNVLVRVGDDLLARLPRRAAAAGIALHEQRWLPVLAPRLPLPVPTPVRVGVPGEGYPWPWSVVPYLTGTDAARTPPDDPDDAADVLARFLAALHRPAPDDAPRSAVRGVPLADRAQTFERNLGLATTGPEPVLPQAVADALAAVWRQALAAPEWDRPAVWCHGDLHPANVLVDGGRVSAVVDFGDVTAGDPACDLAVGWMLLPAPSRGRFLAAYRDLAAHSDDALVVRAHGWAASLGLVLATHSADDPVLRRVGHATIAAVLE